MTETAQPDKVVTTPERMEYLQNMHDTGMQVYFRYPNWNVWVFIDCPQWLPHVDYTVLHRARPEPKDWIIPVGRFRPEQGE